MCNFLITLVSKLKGAVEEWAFTGLYGPVKSEEDVGFWTELDDIGRGLDLPWLIGGDFKAVRKKNERRNGKASKYERRKFLSLLEDHGLLEFDRMGPSFIFFK